MPVGKKVLFFSILFCILPVAPVSADWSQDAGNAQHTGYTAEEPVPPWTFRWSWNGPDANGGTGNHLYDAPKEARTVMGSGKIYVPAGAHGLYGLNSQSGAQVWNVTVTSFNAAPAYDASTQAVFAGGADGKVYKINANTGAVIQSITVGSPVNKAVLLSGSYVFAVTDNGQLYKLSTANLTPAWAAPYVSNSTVATPPAYSQSKNVIVFAADDLFVHAVNGADGTRKWRVKPSPNTPGGTSQVTAAGTYTGNQFDLGWPVIAEQHGIVFVRMQLTHQAHFEGPNGGRFASTNAENRSWLQQNPQWKNLFALNLDDGTEKFIPAVGYGSTEDWIVSSSSAIGVMGSQPAVKLLPDGKEVAYIHFRNGQTNPPSDFRWSGHMGEMVLDNATVPDLVSGDLRFVAMGNSYAEIIDEQNPITLAGNSLFHAHWAASEGVKIIDRSNTRGITFANPITTSTYPPVMRALMNCSNKNTATHYTTCNLSYVTDGGRYYLGPGYWSYWGVPDPPGWRVGSGNTASTSYSAGFQARYTYVSNGLLVVQGNGGDLLVFQHSGTPLSSPQPSPTLQPSPTPDPADVNNDGTVTISDLQLVISRWLLNGQGDIQSDGKINTLDAAAVIKVLLP